MAEYHVGLNKDGEIIAGLKSKTGKWTNNSVVTDETLTAVRDHLLAKIQKENKDITFGWHYSNGKTLMLKLVEINTKDIKEENEE